MNTNKPYAIMISNGQNEDWEYFNDEGEAKEDFTMLKRGYSDGVYLYKYNSALGYMEVIDSYYEY